MKISDYLNALPDAYRKNPESNNYKLLLTEQQLVEDFRDDINAVEAVLDIHSATGKTLDLYGQMYGKLRGTATDEQYRYLILQRVAQTKADCDYNSIVGSICRAFDIPATDFQLKETENPCEIEVINLPYSILQNIGITSEQLHEIITGMLPMGVKLVPLELVGTLEFSATADEYDENAGFADTEQTIGGYFGYLPN